MVLVPLSQDKFIVCFSRRSCHDDTPRVGHGTYVDGTWRRCEVPQCHRRWRCCRRHRRRDKPKFFDIPVLLARPAKLMFFFGVSFGRNLDRRIVRSLFWRRRLITVQWRMPYQCSIVSKYRLMYEHLSLSACILPNCTMMLLVPPLYIGSNATLVAFWLLD